MLTPTPLRNAKSADLPRVKSLLKQNDLPLLGVDECFDNFVIAENENGSLIGVAGVELYGDRGLLRSVAVDDHFRGLGYGGALVQAALSNARARGVKVIYLFTEDAAAYFQRLGFEAIDRANIDQAVKASPEFTECCKTATAMRKVIGQAE